MCKSTFNLVTLQKSLYEGHVQSLLGKNTKTKTNENYFNLISKET
jgi:hypothetical protein